RLGAELFFVHTEDGILDFGRARGLGDVYKLQHKYRLQMLQRPFLQSKRFGNDSPAPYAHFNAR
uniref:hypothetical protein n=1 Tax=Enterobacter hormaechei TaxID=158836 RepID=UPI001A9CAA81